MYPFGMQMPSRKYQSVTLSNAEGYRYGFNGKEKDKDINSLTAYDYGFRIYNPAIGKFLSVDPLMKQYPMLTPYQFATNMPIWAIDLDGLEGVTVTTYRVTTDGVWHWNSQNFMNAQDAKKGGKEWGIGKYFVDLHFVDSKGTITSIYSEMDVNTNPHRYEGMAIQKHRPTKIDNETPEHLGYTTKRDYLTPTVYDDKWHEGKETAKEFGISFLSLIGGEALGAAYKTGKAAQVVKNSEKATIEANGSNAAVEANTASKSAQASEISVEGSTVTEAAKTIETGTTVLGKYPEYMNLANEIGANKFSIPTNIWNKMTAAEQWTANMKFLDRVIAKGDKIVLSNPVSDIKQVSGYFKKELEYLIEKGYKLSSDGTQMIK